MFLTPLGLLPVGLAPATSQTQIALSGAATCVATASAVLTTSIVLSGSVASTSSASGALATGIALQGGAAGITVASSGALTTAVRLQGQATTTLTTNAPSLITSITLAGNADITVTGSASLTHNGIVPDNRYARPKSDVSAGPWVPSSGSSLADMLKEAEPDATSYVETTSPGAFTVLLNDVIDPGTSSGQAFRYQVWSEHGNDLRFTFLQGATVIATWDVEAVPLTPTILTRNLTALECDALVPTTGAFRDLKLTIEAIEVV